MSNDSTNDFRVAALALDLAHYASMHAAAPEYNTWGSIAEGRFKKLADALGFDLVKREPAKQQEAA